MRSTAQKIPDSEQKLSRLARIPEEDTRKFLEDGEITRTMPTKKIDSLVEKYTSQHDDDDKDESSEDATPAAVVAAVTELLIWDQRSQADNQPAIFHDRDKYPNAIIVYVAQHGSFFYSQAENEAVIPMYLKVAERRLDFRVLKVLSRARPVYIIYRGELPNAVVDIPTDEFESLDLLVDVFGMAFPTANKSLKGLPAREGWELIGDEPEGTEDENID